MLLGDRVAKPRRSLFFSLFPMGTRRKGFVGGCGQVFIGDQIDEFLAAYPP